MQVQKTCTNITVRWLIFDGERIMAGKRKCFVGNIRTQLTDYQLLDALFIHCIRHQQELSGIVLDTSYKLKPIVSALNFIRGMLLFSSLSWFWFLWLVFLHSTRWLSCGDVTSCFFYISSEVTSIFVSENDRADALLKILPGCQNCHFWMTTHP